MIGGATILGIATDAAKADSHVVAVAAGAALILFSLVGGYRAWKVELKSAEHLGNEVDDLQVRLQNAAPTLIGGAGGDGGSGGIGDIVMNGNGGGGGSVTYGEGAVAYGGEGGKPPVSAFEMLAPASLGMGYGLEEFITTRASTLTVPNSTV